MIDQLKLDFCMIHINENYMIVTVNEGVNITVEHNEVLINLVDTYYNDKQFVYITNRMNSYSVDPAIYKNTSKIKNLIGFCVVSKNFMAKSTAKIERLFLDKPFEILDNLEDAITWAKTLIK